MSTKRYRYEAFDRQGALVVGTKDSSGEQEVVAALREDGLVPTKVELQAEERRLLFQKKITTNDLIDFTEALSSMVEASIPIDRALFMLEGVTENDKLKRLIAELRREVKDGKSLADFLATRSDVFSTMYVNLVRAGEEGGILAQILPRISRFLKESEETKNQVITALIYPVILVIVGGLSVLLLIIFVVPQFAQIFDDAGGRVPASAAILFSLSSVLRSFGWFLPLIPASLFYGWKFIQSSPERVFKWHDMVLRVPVLGKLFVFQDIGAFARTLGSLLDAGVPLSRGLHIAHGVVSNVVLAQIIKEAAIRVRGGVGLGKALAEFGHVPTLMHQLISVGEETGRTAAILLKLADTYELGLKKQVKRLVAFLEPFLILTMGVLVGGVVMIMLSAVFSINDAGF